MPQVQFVAQSGFDPDNIAAATGRLVNVYPEPTVEGDTVLKSVFGMSDHVELDGVFVRAMATINGVLYAACNGQFVSISVDGSVSVIGAVDDSIDCSISGNNGDVTIVSGGKYYVWDGVTLTQPTPGNFTDFGSHDFIANYTVLGQRGGNQIQWSGLGLTTLPALNFASADGIDDEIVRVLNINGVMWVLKERSREIWYHTGETGVDAFQRMTGGIQDVGLAGFGLVAKIPGSAFLVGSDGRAHIVSGYSLQPVSTPPVETAIKTMGPEYCLTYEDEGHTFCAIVFKDAPAWVYDIATGLWHERAEGVDLNPWTASVTAKAHGRWYVGRDTGAVSILSRSNSDGDTPLAREVTSSTLRMDGKRFTAREFEIFPRQGFATGTVELRTSKDGGITWGTAKAKQIGPTGNYGNRVIWRNLGQARQLTARLRITDPIEVPILTTGRVVV
jgi:hypothetical protein